MEGRYKIMIVDDLDENLQLLSDILDPDEYSVNAFSDPFKAIAGITEYSPDLVLLDINMPLMNGFEVCRRIKDDEENRNIPVVFISALSEPFDKVKAFNAGGTDYITKPFQVEELNARIRNHIKIRELQSQLENSNVNLKRIVDDQVEEIAAAQISTIIAIVKLAEARDDSTGKHIERTRTLCKMLAKELARTSMFGGMIDDTFISTIYISSPLHDVGKIAVSDTILQKQGRLTDEEYSIMKKHTIYGMQTLNKVHAEYPQNSFINMGIEIAWHHHEKWDGSGYPDGLRGNQIPIEARIMAIVDVYDALRSKRIYKEAFSHEKSIDMIIRGKGGHFDPDVTAAFLNLDFETGYERLNA